MTILADQLAGAAVEPEHLAEHPQVAAAAAAHSGEQPARPALARVLQSTAPAPDRHAHLRFLRGYAKFGKKPGQQRVCALVVNDEPGVDGQLAAIGQRDLVRVGVAADPAVRLEQRDVVGPRQDVPGGQPGHAAADHGNPAAAHPDRRPAHDRATAKPLPQVHPIPGIAATSPPVVMPLVRRGPRSRIGDVRHIRREKARCRPGSPAGPGQGGPEDVSLVPAA